jgi:triosephosphate isomerase
MLVVGNWKMHGDWRGNAQRLDALHQRWLASSVVTLAVCVPSPYLGQAQQALQHGAVAWGAQDVSAHAAGAYTGEVSAAMLADFGARYAIVGHSERRQYHGETSEHVGAKAQAALQAGITPIVCVGESLAQRQAGQTEAVVLGQLNAVLDALGEQASAMVLAYEPIWAIGTGQTATAGQAQAVHAALRAQLRQHGAATVPLLYGGSVNPSNATDLLAQADINGALVGGASLKADDFLAIGQAALSAATV